MSWGRTSSFLAIGLLAASCGGSPTQSTPPDQFPNGPKITCPAAPAPLTSPTGQATTVQYGTPTNVGGAPSVNISCAPPAGALFPIGTTAVVCTATDARQRTDSCTFNVTVIAPAKINLTRFVAFGDSITAGEDGRDFSLGTSSASGTIRPTVLLPFDQTYPGGLEIKLRSRYTTQGPSVANSGNPSEKAVDAVNRFNGVVGGSYEVVLLMEGSNDIGSRDSRDIAPAREALRSMVRNARSRNMRVFLATVPPMVPGRRRALAWSLVPDLNNAIRSVASSEGATLVDVEAGFGSSFDQYISEDGLHPNATGYAKIADLFFTAIRSSLEAQGSLTAPASLPLVRTGPKRKP